MHKKKLTTGTLAAVLAGLAGLAGLAQAAADDAAPLFGFRPADVTAQLALEQRFDASLQAADLQQWLKAMSAGANHVGAAHNRANAEYTRDLFREWGFKAEIETFDVLLPTLKQHAVELISLVKYRARLHEPPVPGDATSARTDAMAPYNAYGADGDVTGELVYVNFGTEDDYRMLERLGVSVKGRIAIARYGGVWRGLKPKLAAEHGAIGCIIYSDPRDDGYVRGDPYPKGGWRNADGVQRGSVLDIVTYTGDPLTPGVGATPAAARLSLPEARTVMKIPVLPISWGDAQPLLRALAGPQAPPDWRGGLPLTYHVGAGPARVRVMVKSNWQQQRLYNVIATLPGSELPDEWVLRGNHRDGWVYGAWDPLSGHVAMMAEAKAIGALAKTGWRPKRTLVYASWDGEEPGLLGSTEWAEAHADELRQKAVLYLNSDENTRGFIDIGGSHTLQRLVNDVTRGIKDPQSGVSTLARLRAAIESGAHERGASEDLRHEAKLARDGADFTLDALGTGSDYTPFLQHLGIASLNVQYSGEEDQAGVYHSAYDT
jgi:N-acetylated-alpha-linked acidic dipeptidase